MIAAPPRRTGCPPATLLALLRIGALGLLAGSLTRCGDGGPAQGAGSPEAPRTSPTEAGPPPELTPWGNPIPPSARRETWEEMFAALDLEFSAADGGGAAELLEDPAVPARARAEWVVVYRAGPEGIVPGGSIRFQVSAFWGWDAPQDLHPDGPGFTAVVTAAAGVELATGCYPGCLRIEVKGRPLEAGEEIRITYGVGGSARSDRFAERGEAFYLFVDGDGDGIGKLIARDPHTNVGPRTAVELRATLPTTCATGAPFSLQLAFLDPFANAAPDFAGEVEILGGEGLELPERVVFEEEHGGRLRVAGRALSPGVHEVQTRVGDRRATSNPMLVIDHPPRILWGDLHGHSQLSDGTGTPQDYYVYARDFAGLDVAALTDHDHWGMRKLDSTPEMWQQIRDAARRFHEPGRFVTLLGYEWTSWLYGHRHVLYFADEGDVLSCMTPECETPEGLWRALEQADARAVTIPHHSGGEPVATDWSFAPHPVYEPLVEIVSVHGSSEVFGGPLSVRARGPGHFVRDALDRGYRLGFVGSGDSHDGHPGLAHLGALSGGLAAIYAEENTREAVLDAFRRRQVYATSGPRIFLQFKLGEHPMGSTVSHSELEPGTPYRARVIGTAPLQSVDLIKNGELYFRQELDDSRATHFEFNDPEIAAGDYAYVRVLQRNGAAAWASPIWID